MPPPPQAYFVTGVLDDSIYDPDCFFADPTVAFTGGAKGSKVLI